MWLKIQDSLDGVHNYMLQMCVLHCIVFDKFDQMSIAEKVCERSLKECIGILTTQLLDVIERDEIRSVSNLQQRLPVWKFEPFANFSVAYLDRLMGLQYPASGVELPSSRRNFERWPIDMLIYYRRKEVALESDTSLKIQLCFNDAAGLCRHFVSTERDSAVAVGDVYSDDMFNRHMALYDECKTEFGSFMKNSRELDRIDSTYLACCGLESQFWSLEQLRQSLCYDATGRSWAVV